MGGINLPLAFTQTTNVTLRPLFPDVSLRPAFCFLQKAFCCEQEQMIPLLHLNWIWDAEKKHIFTSFIQVLKWVYDSWHLLSPNAFIKFVSYALRKHNCGCLFMNWQKQPWRLILLLTFRYRASSIKDRRFAALQRTLFIYLINKYISLSDTCLTVHHCYK